MDYGIRSEFARNSPENIPFNSCKIAANIIQQHFSNIPEQTKTQSGRSYYPRLSPAFTGISGVKNGYIFQTKNPSNLLRVSLIRLRKQYHKSPFKRHRNPPMEQENTSECSPSRNHPSHVTSPTSCLTKTRVLAAPQKGNSVAQQHSRKG